MVLNMLLSEVKRCQGVDMDREWVSAQLEDLTRRYREKFDRVYDWRLIKLLAARFWFYFWIEKELHSYNDPYSTDIIVQLLANSDVVVTRRTVSQCQLDMLCRWGVPHTPHPLLCSPLGPVMSGSVYYHQ